MKKIHLLYILPIVVATLFTASCKKKKGPEPQPLEEEVKDSCETMMCLPSNVAKFFLPTGIWSDGDGSSAAALTFSTGEFENSDCQFVYTVGASKWGGLNFLNNNDWAAKIKLQKGATHCTFDYQCPAGLTLKFTPLPDDGGTETLLPATTDWTAQSIALPATYADSITLAGTITYAAASGTHTFNFRNVKFIKQP